MVGSQKAAASEMFNSQYEAEKMVYFKARVDELLAQNEALRQSQAKSEKDTHEFVAYFQRELAKKDDAIAVLTEQSVNDKVHYEMKIENMQKSNDKEYNRLKSSSSAREAELTMRLTAAASR